MANSGAGIGNNAVAWSLFGLRGRISRHVYWLGYASVFSLQLALARPIMQNIEAMLSGAPDQASLWPNIVVLVTIYSHLAITVKRLHDVGYSGFLSIAMFVPLVNFFFTIWIGMLPGTPGPNRYGDVPDRVPA